MVSFVVECFCNISGCGSCLGTGCHGVGCHGNFWRASSVQCVIFGSIFYLDGTFWFVTHCIISVFVLIYFVFVHSCFVRKACFRLCMTI